LVAASGRAKKAVIEHLGIGQGLADTWAKAALMSWQTCPICSGLPPCCLRSSANLVTVVWSLPVMSNPAKRSTIKSCQRILTIGWRRFLTTNAIFQDLTPFTHSQVTPFTRPDPIQRNRFFAGVPVARFVNVRATIFWPAFPTLEHSQVLAFLDAAARYASLVDA